MAQSSALSTQASSRSPSCTPPVGISHLVACIDQLDKLWSMDFGCTAEEDPKSLFSSRGLVGSTNGQGRKITLFNIDGRTVTAASPGNKFIIALSSDTNTNNLYDYHFGAHISRPLSASRESSRLSNRSEKMHYSFLEQQIEKKNRSIKIPSLFPSKPEGNDRAIPDVKKNGTSSQKHKAQVESSTKKPRKEKKVEIPLLGANIPEFEEQRKTANFRLDSDLHRFKSSHQSSRTGSKDNQSSKISKRSFDSRLLKPQILPQIQQLSGKQIEKIISRRHVRECELNGLCFHGGLRLPDQAILKGKSLDVDKHHARKRILGRRPLSLTRPKSRKPSSKPSPVCFDNGISFKNLKSVKNVQEFKRSPFMSKDSRKSSVSGNGKRQSDSAGNRLLKEEPEAIRLSRERLDTKRKLPFEGMCSANLEDNNSNISDADEEIKIKFEHSSERPSKLETSNNKNFEPIHRPANKQIVQRYLNEKITPKISQNFKQPEGRPGRGFKEPSVSKSGEKDSSVTVKNLNIKSLRDLKPIDEKVAPATEEAKYGVRHISDLPSESNPRPAFEDEPRSQHYGSNKDSSRTEGHFPLQNQYLSSFSPDSRPGRPNPKLHPGESGEDVGHLRRENADLQRLLTDVSKQNRDLTRLLESTNNRQESIEAENLELKRDLANMRCELSEERDVLRATVEADNEQYEQIASELKEEMDECLQENQRLKALVADKEAKITEVCLYNERLNAAIEEQKHYRQKSESKERELVEDLSRALNDSLKVQKEQSECCHRMQAELSSHLSRIREVQFFNYSSKKNWLL